MSGALFFVAVAVATLICVPRDTVNASSHETLISVMQSGKYKDVKPDVILFIGNSKFHVHKEALAEASEVFRDILNSNPKAEEVTEKIGDIQENAAVAFLVYLYSGTLPSPLSSTDMISLLTLAERYKVTGIKESCSKDVPFMTCDDALKLLSWGFKNPEPELSKIILSKAAEVILNSPKKALENEKAWRDFELEHPDAVKIFSITKDIVVRSKDAKGTSSSAGENPLLQNGKYDGTRVPRDFSLSVNGRKIYVHKALLTEVSEVFREILSTNPEAKDVPVKLDNIPEASLDYFLDCLYTGKLSDYRRRDVAHILIDLLTLAERYKVKGIEEMCVDRVSGMTFDGALMVLSLGLNNPEVPKKVLSEAASLILNFLHNCKGIEDPLRDLELQLPDVARTLRIVEPLM